FADPAFLNELLAAREDLIDSFARGRLDGSDRERFESELRSSPVLFEKVEFARAFVQILDASPPVRPVAVVADPRPGRPAASKGRRRLVPRGRCGPVDRLAAGGPGRRLSLDHRRSLLVRGETPGRSPLIVAGGGSARLAPAGVATPRFRERRGLSAGS